MKASGFNFDTTYTTLPEQFFSRQDPKRSPNPSIILLNDALAASMGLDFSAWDEPDLADLFSGNHLPEGATPFSQAYAGHQFGHFTMLGDGRAHLWGEHLTPDGKRLDIQFKGSGRTPYSRRGDGHAALGPMLREYLISEAMAYLNIPTTRSLAVVATGENIVRHAVLPGAILTRVAQSHIRVGTFEFAAHYGDIKALKVLLDYTIERHDPSLIGSDNKALDLLKAVMKRQANLIVHWMRVGFIHGVMNTDNMTLSGQTIDYGPCAFMDAFDPNTVFSSIDHAGRYAYANQPKMAAWNLARLAEALLPLIHKDQRTAIDLAEQALDAFSDMYQQQWLTMMRAKLGLFGTKVDDEQLIADLLAWMHKHRADYTNTFRDLACMEIPPGKHYTDPLFTRWHKHWQARLNINEEPMAASLQLMRNTNPAIIPRNHHVEHVLEAAYDGDLGPIKAFLSALSAPYKERAELKPYQLLPKPDESIYQTFCGT